MSLSTQPPKGWTFYTADFSCVAEGTRTVGRVMLKRDIQGTLKWHLLDGLGRDETDLYVSGSGTTLESALRDACVLADRIGDLP